MMVKRPQKAQRETGLAASLELELPRNVEAPVVARAAVIGHCDDFDLDGSLCHTLVLLVSEIVSNAVLHSRGPADAPIILTATVTEDAVRITVTDAGRGFIPKLRDPACVGAGYGLYLVDKAATRWGVDSVGGTRVWFELSRTA
jgi:anti-sigma regulatory factor (Ser/Thr protein kinase)